MHISVARPRTRVAVICGGGVLGLVLLFFAAQGHLLFSTAHLKAEPTGALSVGALLTSPDQFRDRTVCCIVSGGNVDTSLYLQLLDF